MIYQAIKPDWLRKFLERHNVPQKTFARLGEVSDAMLSQFLTGTKALSYELQNDFDLVTEFVREVVEANSAPVDFRQADEVARLFEEFKHKRLEANVLSRVRENEQSGGKMQRAGAE